MAKNIRQLNGYNVQDPSSIDNLEYNPMSGAQKVTEVGRHLIAIPKADGTFTTNVTTATALPSLGRNLAVYNNAGTIASLTLGEDATITVLAAGVTDASGHVGIPLQPNAWTYIACSMQGWAIASAATVLVFLIDDTSYIRQEVATFQGT